MARLVLWLLPDFLKEDQSTNGGKEVGCIKVKVVWVKKDTNPAPAVIPEATLSNEPVGERSKQLQSHRVAFGGISKSSTLTSINMSVTGC